MVSACQAFVPSPSIVASAVDAMTSLSCAVVSACITLGSDAAADVFSSVSDDADVTTDAARGIKRLVRTQQI